MINNQWIITVIATLFLMFPFQISAQDSISPSRRFIHRLGMEVRPAYVIPTNPFLRGENEGWKPIQESYAFHLKYSFKFHPQTCVGRLYQDAYQGIGLAYYTFNEKRELGNPVTLYLFQGARIAEFSRRLSFNYEWNFGLSFGWHPYDNSHNYYNDAVGSRMNAYINAGFYLDWILSKHFDLTVGADFTHFSNGNTKFPNRGINTVGAKIGLVYNFNRMNDRTVSYSTKVGIPPFIRHISYDLLLFGSWRRKGVYLDEGNSSIGVASPHVYPVAGFNFAPMYNLNYKFRFGLSVDGVYDGSANVYAGDVEIDESGVSKRHFYRPGLERQLSLGLSARGEYVMPYFAINFGIGTSVLGHGDLKGVYQALALKIAVTRNSFLHIGYNLQNFHTPNYLMLGLGFCFHNKSPQVRH